VGRPVQSRCAWATKKRYFFTLVNDNVAATFHIHKIVAARPISMRDSVHMEFTLNAQLRSIHAAFRAKVAHDAHGYCAFNFN
jgi:hypothetical protein